MQRYPLFSWVISWVPSMLYRSKRGPLVYGQHMKQVQFICLRNFLSSLMRAINFLCLEDSLLCNMPNKIPLHNPAMTSMSATRFVVGGMFMISSKMKIEEKKAITETNAKFPYCFLRTSEISASPDNSSILINRLSSVFSFSLSLQFSSATVRCICGM